MNDARRLAGMRSSALAYNASERILRRVAALGDEINSSSLVVDHEDQGQVMREEVRRRFAMELVRLLDGEYEGARMHLIDDHDGDSAAEEVLLELAPVEPVLNVMGRRVEALESLLWQALACLADRSIDEGEHQFRSMLDGLTFDMYARGTRVSETAWFESAEALLGLRLPR